MGLFHDKRNLSDSNINETNKWRYNAASSVLPNVGKSTLFNCLSNAKAQAANFPFCTIEPNVGVITVPDRRLIRLAEIDNPKRVVPTTIEIVDIAGLVKGRLEGRRTGQQIPGQHPQHERDHPRPALLRQRQHHPRRRLDRPRARQGHHRHRIAAEGPRNRREPARQDPEAGHLGRRQARQARRGTAAAIQGGAGTGALGPHRRTGQGGPQTGRRPQPADRQARVVRLQRRRKERRDGQRLHRGRPGGHRRRAGRNARHRRRHGGRHRRTGRLRRAADVPRRPGTGGVGRGAPDQIGLQIAQPRNVFHHRGRRDPRLDLPARHESPADGRHHPHRFRKGVHPRRGHQVRRLHRAWVRRRRAAMRANCRSKARSMSSQDGDIMHFLFNV